MFDNAEKRKAEEILSEVERKHRPISDLAGAILLGSLSCGEALKPYLGDTTQADKHTLFPAVCYEFIFFFAHLMNRNALSILGNDGRIKLQNEIAPLIVVPAISGFFDHWPEDRKEKMINDFYDDLNDAEVDYSSCRELLPPSVEVLFKEVLEDLNSFSENCLFSKLINRIISLSEKSLSPEAIMLLLEISTKTLIDMNLKQQVEGIKKVL
ncbi:MAG TPA: hypothetical protein VMT12_01785 [Syntrophales bacterium]|nr:hypothetical protein [Syntrophales bacterium]